MFVKSTRFKQVCQLLLSLIVGVKKHLQLLGKTVITSVRSDFAIIKKKWKWS